MPGLQGSAVVGIDIVLDDIIELLASYDVPGGGYLFLLSQEGDIVSHPDSDAAPTAAGMRNISDVPGYAVLSEIADDTYGIARFTNPYGEYSYIMTFPIQSTGWTLVSVFPVSVTSVPVWQLLSVIILTIVFVLVMVTVLIGFLLSKKVMHPLEIINQWLRLTAENGNAEWTAEDRVTLEHHKGRRDEIGTLFRSYENIIEYISHVRDSLKTIADGNLDVSVNVRSEQDILSQSLQTMVKHLNSMLSEINTTSGQVSFGSRQISDSSKRLADGTAEQAATVQELSTSISEITEKTRVNAELAEKAAELATSIKVCAEKGSTQMDEMVGAVNEISEASQSISKVIKTIDDIAYQTNILALNAAVEAARAGQHGKGFAVVADEVRTLATKSAEAAKDTGVLISDSMEKAQHGARIAKDTAESLAEIVTGINESSEIIGEIADASDSQTLGITKVHRGIDLVSSIVQQNSNAAAESAAVSGELDAQSATMKEMVARFKTKEATDRNLAAASLPPGNIARRQGRTFQLPE